MTEDEQLNSQPRQTDNLRIASMTPLLPPAALKKQFPLSAAGREIILNARNIIVDIISRRDPRLLVLIGPCSIHDVEAAYRYAEQLQQLHHRYRDTMYIVMRTYFEKPRTTVGWRGLINDPHLDGSHDMGAGLQIARELLLKITALGLPTAVEMLDTVTPHYFADLVSFGSIGARTVESQPHRAMASGLSMPVGFKNGTDGNVRIAIDAMIAARAPQSFLGIDEEGHSSVACTTGNNDGTIILRGGKNATNYHATAIKGVVEQLHSAQLPAGVIVDCSHANSRYHPEEQELVMKTVLRDRDLTDNAVVGVMIESNINPGTQGFSTQCDTLKYGVSITDGCIGWEDTERLLAEADAILQTK